MLINVQKMRIYFVKSAVFWCLFPGSGNEGSCRLSPAISKNRGFEEMNDLSAIFPIIAAILTASYLYVAKATGANPENFDLTKWLSTVIIGGGITVGLIITGTDVSAITSDNIGIQMIAYSGLIVLIEKGVKIVIGTIRINISTIAGLLPDTTVPKSVSASTPAPSPAVPGVCVSPVADPLDQINKIAVKSYPSILQGVSPFPAQYLIACDPGEGIHAAVKAVVDHGDGSPVEEIPVINGIATVRHTYEYVQGLTLVDNAPSPYYARVFHPKISVTGRDGLRGTLNCDTDSDGKREISLTIEVKDADAVRLGKVTNFPAPSH